MNQHLNIFRFFNESDNPIYIEKNLSRAFVLCLNNHSFFLNEYIRNIVDEEDYEYLFSSITDDTECSIEIEKNTATIERENYKTVYAVAMTSDRGLAMDDFFSNIGNVEKKNFTDIFISVKDIGIVIEVKKTGEDCKHQLFNQILPFNEIKDKVTIKPKKFSWQEVINIMQMIKHIQQLSGQPSVFINHFLELSETRYSSWFEPKPFNNIPFLSSNGEVNSEQLNKRMKQALSGTPVIAGKGYELLGYGDRIGISLPFAWASELIPHFELHQDSTKEYVTFYIWPANTKRQGHSIFSNSLAWVNKSSLMIDGEDFPMEITQNVKLSHFMGKHISSLYFYDENLIKPLHTLNNYRKSGKWSRESWPEFEKLMDDHFKAEFNWRKNCSWDTEFLKSGRSYLFMSLGFEVSVAIPFSRFKSIDKEESNIVSVSTFISKIAQAFQSLI